MFFRHGLPLSHTSSSVVVDVWTRAKSTSSALVSLFPRERKFSEDLELQNVSSYKFQKVAINLFLEGEEEEMEVRRCYLLHNNPLHSSSFRRDVRDRKMGLGLTGTGTESEVTGG